MIVNPQSPHCVVRSGIDAHWHIICIISSNPLIDVEQIAVLLPDGFQPEPVNSVRKIQVNTLSVGPHAAPFVAHFLRIARCDVTWNKVAETWVAVLLIVVSIGLRNVSWR